MNDTPNTARTAPDGRPAGRYGPPARRPSRWVLILLPVVVLGVGLAASITAYRGYGSPPIQGEHLAFEVTAEDAISVSFEVVRDEPHRPAVCVLESRAEDGGEVGRREVYVPPAEGPSVHTATVRTSQRPVLAEVFGCSYDVPEYLMDDALTPTEGGMRPSG